VAIALAAVAAFAIGTLLRQIGSGGDGGSGALSASASVSAKLADRPQDAALAALAAARADASTEAELAMIDVAVDGRGVERVVKTGSGEVSAALVLEGHLVTAGGNGSVQVWRRSDGALLGETEAAAPIAALTDTDTSSPFLAAVDDRGAVELVDLADPGKPRVLPLGPRLAGGETPLAVAFSKEPLEVVAVGAGGELLRVDQTTGKIVSRASLRDFRGSLPWRSDGSGLHLSAAKFVPEVYEDEEGLLVATADGSVADLDLARGQGKTVLDAGVAPGRVLDLDRAPYSEFGMAVAASGGYVVSEEDALSEPRPIAGPPVTAVAIDSEGGLWRGGSGGVAVPETSDRPLSGPPVRGFGPGFHGIAALNAGGRASVLGPAGVGISMADTEVTPIASFDPDGRLLIASGYDANHIEEIRAVRPQPRLPDDGYQEEDVLKTYRPDREWWPEAEDPDALYLNDVVSDGEHVVAAGQDPEGEAAVMVWDAHSGEPLQHLTLGTGGLSTALPSIVTKVVLLPERHEIAAYSAAQELIAIWSTESWELEDSVPVGAVGSLSVSPDESTIVTVGLAADPEFDVESGEPIDLNFVDVEGARLDHEVRLPGAVEAAISPDGATLAVADAGGSLRFRSADGRQREGAAVELGGAAAALAWRPDGELLAVALREGEILLVDPRSGEVSESLPVETYSPSQGLSWSKDGSLLATLSAEIEEEGEGYDPGPARIWTLDGASLERRMCELAGCGSSSAEAIAAAGPLDDASRLSGIDLVFGREGDLVAADLEGETARIGHLEEYPNPPVAYDWSGDGDLAWSSPGQVSVLLSGAERPRAWPCACAGVAWDGEEVLSLKLDGSALVRVDPARGSLSTSPIRGLPPFAPTLLGVVGGQPIAAAYEREPDRSTFSDLYRIDSDGSARFIGEADGSIYKLWPSSSPRALAFVAGLSSGVCYSTTNVGIVAAGAGGEVSVRVPPPPLGEEPVLVRSVQMAADGSVGATFGRIGCDEEGILEDQEPLAERYLLDAGRWQPTGAEGFDVQATANGTAEVKRSDQRAIPGALALVSDGDRRLLAPQIEGLVARP
jgi:WD40 repeat protein